jgi:thioredoxin 2
MAESLRLVCPHCATINRIPATRLGDGPRCGQCHEALLLDRPVELTGATFRKHVDNSDIPWAIDFWAPWCGPCLSMAPEFAAAVRELGPQVRLGKLNTDAEPVIASEFGIRSIPTLIMFKGGREIARQAGAMSRQDIVRWIRAHS